MSTTTNKLIPECTSCIEAWATEPWFKALIAGQDYVTAIICAKVPGLSFMLSNYLASLSKEKRRQAESEINHACRLTDTAILVNDAKTNTNKRIADTIRTERMRQRLSQSTLANMAGIQQPQLARIESATYSDTSVRTIAAIAAALRINIELH